VVAAGGRECAWWRVRTVRNVTNRAAQVGFGDLSTVEVDFVHRSAESWRFGELCTGGRRARAAAAPRTTILQPTAVSPGRPPAETHEPAQTIYDK
jgi:hypothetical protein